MNRIKQGELAETIVKSWLEHHGYGFIERNFHRRVGEIDLIFNHPCDGSVVFVEARYRSDQRYGGGISSVDWRKRRKLVRTANAWLQCHANSRTSARIDVIALRPARQDSPTEKLWLGHELTWVKDAVQQD